MLSEQKPGGPLNVAFLGGGRKSAVGRAHLSAIRMDGRYQLVAGVFSRSWDENLATADAYFVDRQRTYPGIAQLIEAERERLDAVIVLTPTPDHEASVVPCLAARLPVICEKALASTVEGADHIAEAQRANRGFLAVTFNYSGYPMVRELRALIARGALGRIVHFRAEMPQEGFIRLLKSGRQPCPQAWRLADGPIPTIHLDLGVHLHQLVYYLTREHPLEVIADQKSFGWFPDVIDHVAALARYTNGIHGEFGFSKSSLGPRNGLRLQIRGTAAAAEWYQAAPEEIRVYHVDGRHETLDRGGPVLEGDRDEYSRFKAGHPAGYVEAFANLYADIGDCLDQFRATGTWESHEVFGVDVATEGLTMMQAMVDGAVNKRWTAVSSQKATR